MNYIKKIFTQATGYWLHKQRNLPVGADLFVDIRHKIHYNNIDVLFDVGANIGQARKWFRYYLPSTLIYSFEPVAQTFNQLKDSAKNDQHVFFINQALGSKKETKRIRLFDTSLNVLNSLKEDSMNNLPNATEETVTVNTIDSFCVDNQIAKIDLLKIDTEGFELPVLEGASNMLSTGSISFVYCEIGFLKTNHRNSYFPVINEFLADNGYYFFGLYQTDYHDWKRGNHLSNALFINKSVFP